MFVSSVSVSCAVQTLEMSDANIKKFVIVVPGEQSYDAPSIMFHREKWALDWSQLARDRIHWRFV
jgi:hypothetical protein